VTKGGAEGDDDAKGNKCYSRPEGKASGVNVGREMRLGGGNLPEEEAEAADRETNSHESETGADPSEKGSLGCEVDSRILLDGFVH
jgi:hypothetical protein